MITRKWDSTFYAPSVYEECILEDLYDDEFMDLRHPEEFLDDNDLFAEMKDLIKGVDRVVCMSQSKTISGVKATPYGLVAKEEDKTIITLGGLDIKPPEFEIEPDYTPAKIVLDWYFQFMKTPDIEFPYVPVAEPVIPHVAKERAASSDDLDEVMNKAGGLIFSPSYPYADSHDPSGFVNLDYEHKVLMDLEVDNKLKEHSFIFTSRSNYVWHWQKRYRVCALEFNPFHPMALPLIESYNDDGRTVSGRYRWGRGTRDFYFNRESQKMRLHYETWGSLVSFSNYFMGPFDLVSNFDVRCLNIFFKPDKIFNLAPRYIVEGYHVKKSKRNDFYSNIPKNKMNMKKGVNEIFTYYSSIPVIIESLGQEYLEVSAMYELRYYSMSRWELFVIERSTGKTVVSLIYSDKKNIQRQENNRLFIEYSIKTTRLKVYVLKETATEEEVNKSTGSDFFCWSPGCFFFSCPRNGEGSLMRHPSIRTFHQHMEIAKESPSVEYLRETMPEYTGDYAIEESLSSEQLETIRGLYEHEYNHGEIEGSSVIRKNYDRNKQKDA
jgi:hypothetical protein